MPNHKESKGFGWYFFIIWVLTMGVVNKASVSEGSGRQSQVTRLPGYTNTAYLVTRAKYVNRDDRVMEAD